MSHRRKRKLGKKRISPSDFPTYTMPIRYITFKEAVRLYPDPQSDTTRARLPQVVVEQLKLI